MIVVAMGFLTVALVLAIPSSKAFTGGMANNWYHVFVYYLMRNGVGNSLGLAFAASSVLGRSAWI